MQELIGQKLEVVIKKLEESGINYSIKDNNFSVPGDTKLITNVIANDKGLILITGDFVFNIKEANNNE